MGWWDDDDEEGGFFDWLWYDNKPKKREPAWKRDEKLTNKTQPDITPDQSIPKATEKDINDVLHVKKLDFNIPYNTRAHRTDKYECTEDRTNDEGVEEDAELVVRRGQPVRFTLTFDREFNLKKDDLLVILKTGKYADKHPETNGKMTVDESGKTKFTPEKWAANLVSKKGCEAVIDVNLPANIAIGEWFIYIDTKSIVDKKKKIYRYIHSDEIFVLFNPWCKADQTYLDDEDLKKEYVLNEHGCIYRGNKYRQIAKPWYFGQFEADMLDAAFFIIRKCFRGDKQYKLGNAVLVARAIATVVNCCDRDNGVLWGNWSGDYSDGVSPGTWVGSVKILKQYIKTGKPVKYGQCWVFSGVTTTVCRAVGIPARSVTNYASAHDTDNSKTIDVYHKYDDSGNLVPCDNNSDSVWNFHVWNDVWMSRPDLPSKNNEFDGWQAIDATPQEKSDGVFTCGPCSLYAIKHGLVDKLYDSAFVFAEVNADKIFWKPAPGGHVKFKVKPNVVGHNMSTKEPNGKRYDANAFFVSRFRQDVTRDYKFDDDSSDNRKAVERAVHGSKTPKDVPRKDDRDVKFTFDHGSSLNIGQDVECTLKAYNKSKKHTRKIKAVTFTYLSMKYTGGIVNEIKPDRLDIEKNLKPGETYEFVSILKEKDYIGKLEPENCMCFRANAVVEACPGRPEENCMKSHEVDFAEPELECKVPKKVKKGQEFTATVTFSNPLSEDLVNCTAGYESACIQHMSDIRQDNVRAMGKYTGKFTLKAKRCGDHTITFTFNSKQLNVTGSVGLEVE